VAEHDALSDSSTSGYTHEVDDSNDTPTFVEADDGSSEAKGRSVGDEVGMFSPHALACLHSRIPSTHALDGAETGVDAPADAPVFDALLSPIAGAREEGGFSERSPGLDRSDAFDDVEEEESDDDNDGVDDEDEEGEDDDDEDEDDDIVPKSLRAGGSTNGRRFVRMSRVGAFDNDESLTDAVGSRTMLMDMDESWVAATANGDFVDQT
jgi:hypothetical protein